MVMSAKYLLGIFCGFCSHKLFHKPTAIFGKRWGLLMRYAIGYTACMILKQIFIPDESKRDEVLTADILTGVMYGGGVFLGYLADSDEE